MSRYGNQPDKAAFDAEVARLHRAGRDDLQIAISIGVTRKPVRASRARQELPALFGPGGTPTKAYHQLVTA